MDAAGMRLIHGLPLIVALAGCSQTPVTPAGGARTIVPTVPTVTSQVEVFNHLPKDFDRSAWLFAQLETVPAIRSAKVAPARLELNDGQMSGYTGCNGVFGSYQRENTRIQFTGAGISRRFCTELADQEKRMLDVLSRTRFGMIAKANGYLLLLDENKAILAELLPMPPKDN